MAAPQLKRNSIPTYDASGETGRDAGNARVATDRFEPDRLLAQFDFGAPVDPVVQYRRAITVLMAVAIAGIGAIAAIAYFAGNIAAAVVAAGLAALIGFGNWILTNTIDLF